MTPHTPPTHDCSAAATRLAVYFEQLSKESVAHLADYYASDARFKDPFNDVRGIGAIRRVFEHMFESLERPHFVVTRQVVQGAHCFLTWEFRFGFLRFQQGQPQVILGATHLEFSEDGLVRLHRDYWDAAEELYEKLPAVGGLMRWLKRRANS